MKQLVAPVGYWRLWPNAVVLAAARLGPATLRVLDVSSPKLTSLILARRSDVHATDLDDPELVRRWKSVAHALGLERYHTGYEDAGALSFSDGMFDLVLSISVIEHIPGDGDNRALREFARVLKPGGRVIVEVPYRRTMEELIQEYDSKGARLDSPRFYERRYDRSALELRLRTSALILEEQWILGERLPIDPWIATPRLPRPVRLLVLPLEPWLAAANYWMGPDDSMGRPLAALLVFRKEAAGAPA